MAILRSGIEKARNFRGTVDSIASLPASGTDGDIYVVLDIDELREWDNDSGTWVEPVSGGGGPGGTPDWVEDEYTATAGQTVFTLSDTPASLATFSMYVNGIIYDDVTDYTISGTTLTWLDTGFVLEAGDKILARYIK
jgi:hypothetical protein